MDIETEVKAIESIAKSFGNDTRMRDVIDSKCLCNDCKAYICEFTLAKPVIDVIGVQDHLCIECIEQKLGRGITIKDFVPCINNYQMFLGYKLCKGDTQDAN